MVARDAVFLAERMGNLGASTRRGARWVGTEASTGETLEGMELFRARWLFQLGVVYHGWKAYGTEPWFSWARIEDFLPRSLAEL
jgi:hypothetical protein